MKSSQSLLHAAMHITLLSAATLHSPVTISQSSPVADRIKAGDKIVIVIVIVHREASLLFSYKDGICKPGGYALELCLKLAETVRQNIGAKDDDGIEILMLTSANRIPMFAEGKANKEYGSTSSLKERCEKVAFTAPHFITGARMLVKSRSKAERLLGLKVIEAPDLAKAIEIVEKGEADAFVMDDALLYGLAANRVESKALKVVGKFLTTEPLAIMLPKNDPAFKKIVDDEMKRLIRPREIYPIYDKWFSQAIPPKNTALNLRVSYLLRDFWKYPTHVMPF